MDEALLDQDRKRELLCLPGGLVRNENNRVVGIGLTTLENFVPVAKDLARNGMRNVNIDGTAGITHERWHLVMLCTNVLWYVQQHATCGGH